MRAPHWIISDVGLIDRGHVPMPGEVLLARHDVLFLDEWAETRRHVIMVLRQPLKMRPNRNALRGSETAWGKASSRP